MTTLNHPLDPSGNAAFARAEQRFAARVTGYLSNSADDLPHDISERLRVARLNAVSRRKVALVRPAVAAQQIQVHMSGGAASLSAGNPQGDHGLAWWGKIASLLPIAALLVGLYVVNQSMSDDRARELADVDSALLTDDLPPSAYLDSGFAHFLKTSLER